MRVAKLSRIAKKLWDVMTDYLVEMYNADRDELAATDINVEDGRVELLLPDGKRAVIDEERDTVIVEGRDEFDATATTRTLEKSGAAETCVVENNRAVCNLRDPVTAMIALGTSIGVRERLENIPLMYSLEAAYGVAKYDAEFILERLPVIRQKALNRLKREEESGGWGEWRG